MSIWKFKILSDAGVILTKNADYAEMKSKNGCIVFCKKENNFFKYNH